MRPSAPSVPMDPPARMRRPATRLRALLPLAAACFGVACSGEESLDVRPLGSIEDIEQLGDRDDLNVLFVLIDTLRADKLSAYGHPQPTSPTLDYLASTGVLFADHLAQSSWTKSSMASLWTSLYPVHNGVTRFDDALPEAARMPAEIFRDAGFRTTGIWRNGWVAPTFGFEQGFEIYQRPATRSKSAEVRRQNPHLMLHGTDDDVIEEAAEFIRTRRNERWFLYLHLMDVHQFVYDEESALFGSDRAGIYANAIRREDTLINRLFSVLSKEGQLDRTLTLIGSDHGEAFLERGIEGHARHVYRETTEVPLILSFPFRLEAVKVETTSRNIDIWPTVLDLLRLPALEISDGTSLLPAIITAGRDRSLEQQIGRDGGGEGGKHEPGEAAIAHLDRTWGRPSRETAPAMSLVDDRYRLVYSREEDGSEHVQLYDRNTDPRELRDVAKDHPEASQTMAAELKRYEESAPASWAVDAKSVELDQMQLNQLRALGYSIAK